MSDRRLEKLEDAFVEIKMILVEIRKDLNEHMRRTDLLESRMVPIEAHTTRWAFVGKLAPVAAVVGGAVVGVLRALHVF